VRQEEHSAPYTLLQAAMHVAQPSIMMQIAVCVGRYHGLSCSRIRLRYQIVVSRIVLQSHWAALPDCCITDRVAVAFGCATRLLYYGSSCSRIRLRYQIVVLRIELQSH
jgi:hypothetical protein